MNFLIITQAKPKNLDVGSLTLNRILHCMHSLIATLNSAYTHAESLDVGSIKPNTNNTWKVFRLPTHSPRPKSEA